MTINKMNQEEVKGIKYNEPKKTHLIESIKKSFPKELIPTSKTNYILGLILLIVVFEGILSFPLGSISSGNLEKMKIEVGFPEPFFVLSFAEAGENPLRIKALIIDFLIYFLVAYIIDVLINVVLSGFSKKEEKEEKPKIFKNLKVPNGQNKMQTISNYQEEDKSKTKFIKEENWYKQKEI